jgi:hypothetical protein
MVERDHRRMHARLYAPRVSLRVADQLDRVSQLTRVAKVDRFDAFDALAENLVRADLDLVCDRP